MPASTSTTDHQSDAVRRYRSYGLEWAPVERLPAPTADISSADAYDIPDPAQQGSGGREANSPLGGQVQGFAGAGGDPTLRGTHPTFDPTTEHDEAFQFYQDNGYVVIRLLDRQEIASLNAVCDQFCCYPERITVRGQGELVFPLLHYPEVDFTVTHPNQKALIARIMGGWEHVRMVEFNYRGWDPSRHGDDRGMTYHPDCAEGIPLSEYSTRVPYGPPDNLLSFFCKHWPPLRIVAGPIPARPSLGPAELPVPISRHVSHTVIYGDVAADLTDVDESTPSFAVVPRSRRAASLPELRRRLGDDVYREVPILGPAGTCCLMDANVVHTRLDPLDRSKPPRGRRIFHHVFANARQLENADGTPRTPNVPLGVTDSMYSRGVAGPRLTESADPETRRLYSWWSSTQFEWQRQRYDPAFIGDPKAARGPTNGPFSHPGRYQQQQPEVGD
jgi:hypothetical protein